MLIAIASLLPVILIIIVVLLILSNVVVVPQASAFVVERLGAYQQTWQTGVHFKIPLLERVANKVTLKERIADFAPQPVITKDNVTMQIDTVVYRRIEEKLKTERERRGRI